MLSFKPAFHPPLSLPSGGPPVLLCSLPQGCVVCTSEQSVHEAKLYGMCYHPGVCGASIPALPLAAGSEGAQVTRIHASVYIRSFLGYLRGLPLWLSDKESACNAGDAGSTPASGRSPGESNGNPLQRSCLENSMDGGAWRATVPGVVKSRI